MDSVHCINCYLDITRMRRNPLSMQNDEVRCLIQQWITPQLIDQHSVICDACLRLSIQSITETPGPSRPDRQVGHRHVCVCCGQSVLRQRSHTMGSNTDRERHIMNVVAHRIQPRQLRSTDLICHPCWQQCNRAASPSVASLQSLSQVSTDSVNASQLEVSHSEESQMVTGIQLPNYGRAVDTQSHCFYPGCNMTDRHVVPLSLRVWLFKDYKYYVPRNSKICNYHLNSDLWHEIPAWEDVIHVFNVNHIEDFASFVNYESRSLDFENINSMEEYMLWYFLGMSKSQFTSLMSEVPRLAQMHRGSTALAAYLMKLRTGDSDERISSLLQIPRSTLERLMAEARVKLNQDFVPRNLGIGHMTREEIATRNLIIPNGLFGEVDGQRKPVVIVDGTYIYVQKSSNYLYQKETYSLHKYRNLVKPFMLVCSDGYILEVLGPYPATTSDATIMFNEFNDPNNRLRQYFQDGDVFILDRGFRDAVPLLESCNYSVHMPSTLQENEFQLSTLEANKSRKVTICRWVVEVVNGIFKQHFKIFRQDFFNRASKHLMVDFSIAAALINRFHSRIVDRPDAADILQTINTNMFMENRLADYVINNNLNRRRAQFQSINVNNSNVADFPQLTYSEMVLIACGTYQIKQARSYYGEHTRANGMYSIEVCTEMDNLLIEELALPDNCYLLRGKIHSRHISTKVYFVYMIINNSLTGRDAIQNRYCNCLVGRRTVGTCAHIMSIIWYLAWARYQSNIRPPAQFLDDLLIVYNDE